MKKSMNKSKDSISNGFNKNNETNLISNNLLNFPKQNKNMINLNPLNSSINNKNIFVSSFNVPINSRKFSIISNNNVNINEKVEQYKRHPYRRLNLKIVGENIKQKLMEMNDLSENDMNELTTSSPSELKKYTNLLRNRYSIKVNDSNTNIMNLNLSVINEPNKKINSVGPKQNLNLFENNKDILENNDKNNYLSHIIQLKIPKKKIKEDNKNSEKKMIITI